MGNYKEAVGVMGGPKRSCVDAVKEDMEETEGWTGRPPEFGVREKNGL